MIPVSWCWWRGSNPHCADFKSAASASWATPAPSPSVLIAPACQGVGAPDRPILLRAREATRLVQACVTALPAACFDARRVGPRSLLEAASGPSPDPCPPGSSPQVPEDVFYKVEDNDGEIKLIKLESF